MLDRHISLIKDGILYVRGILSRRYAYKGPHIIVPYVTNVCTMNCVGCWHHSFRKRDSLSLTSEKQHIKTENFMRIIDEAGKMNVRSVILSGSGEPFMHPDILRFIQYIKQKNMECHVVTNGAFIKEDNLITLSSLRLDSLILSLWDHDSKRYEELRPGHGRALENIKRWMKFYKTKKMLLPKLKLVYLISNKNYSYVNEMYEFSKIYAINSILFKLFRIEDGMTNDFLLSQKQIAAVIAQLERISMINKGRIPTNIHEIHSFLKRVQVKNGLYQNNFLREMPCYIGWFYTIILLNGDVSPCCGCRKYALGNVYKNSLSEIWNSKLYEEFRYNTLTDKHSGMYKNWHCGDLCSDYNINLRLNNYFGWAIKTI